MCGSLKWIMWCLMGVAGCQLPCSATAAPAPLVAENPISITCTAAYYAEFTGDAIRLVEVERGDGQTPMVSVGGIVLSVIKPESLRGKIVCFHFDGPPTSPSECWYQPGVVYQGLVRATDIGRFAFMCDPGLAGDELSAPLPRTASELRRVLSRRNWARSDVFVRAAMHEPGEKVLFEGLYGVLTNAPSRGPSSREQWFAAHYLRKYHLPCTLSVTVALRQTLEVWDEGIGDWPLYLQEYFGKERLRAALAELEKEGLSAKERSKLEVWRLWLGVQEGG